jgi:hypothetical protein
MKMTSENDGYKKIVEILRNSKPDLIRPEEIGNEVINKIQRENQKSSGLSEFIESLFGWVYVGWVRRSLVGAAVILIAVFVYQQAFIFKQVKNISKQVVITGNETAPGSSSALDKRLTLYKISSRLSPGGEIKFSESQLEELLDSYYDLQVKYKDLLRIIEEDPEMKNYIENKLNQEKKYKPDI